MSEIIVPSTWRERLEAIGGRRRDAWLVMAVVAAVALGALALWSRGGEARIAPPATSDGALSPPGAVAPPNATVAPTPVPGVILVHVAGVVRRPGLYELSAGARVADAIKAAGGPRPRGDLDGLNLAEAVTDGQKVEVAARGAAGRPVAAPAPSSSPGVAVVNLNQADQVALESIPGIGPVTATAILEYRAAIGSFSSIEQLLEVSGIGPVTLENLRPYVSI
ncbi:MAG: helix-hairpin-helix domain-containing protein [Actinomycetota bacterium]